MLKGAWAQIAAQRGDLFGWAPILFGLGITVYFAALTEPAALMIYSALAGAVALFASLWVLPERLGIAARRLRGCRIARQYGGRTGTGVSILRPDPRAHH